MRIPMIAVVIAVALVAVAVPVAPISGQTLDGEPGSSVQTRADLERLLTFYEEVAASPAYSGRLQEEARVNLERVQVRLREGDFKVGDRIVLTVEGEPELPDTVAVESGPKVVLPLFGDIPLGGVLRSEIEAHLTRELGASIRNPVVRARGLMRLSIQGQVRIPGFYVVPAEMLLSEALMVAGGPGPESDLEALRVERGSSPLIEGEQLQEAMREGRTLDQLNLQAGDQIVLPGEGGGIWGSVGQIALGVVPAVLIALLIGR